LQSSTITPIIGFTMLCVAHVGVFVHAIRGPVVTRSRFHSFGVLVVILVAIVFSLLRVVIAASGNALPFQ